MQGKGLVFVTGDRLGDQLTALLEEAGCQVVRGPQSRPPALTVFPKEEWPGWFYVKNPEVLPAWRQRLAALG